MKDLDVLMRIRSGLADGSNDAAAIDRIAAALRAVEGAWTTTVFEAGVNFGEEVFDIRPIANAHRTLIGKRVALVPLDPAGSAEGVVGG